MHTRRAGHVVTRPLNCGVRRHMMNRMLSALVVTTMAAAVLWVLLWGMSKFFLDGQLKFDPTPLAYRTWLHSKPIPDSSCETLNKSVVELIGTFKYCAQNSDCSLDQPGCKISGLDGPTDARIEELKLRIADYESYCGTCPVGCGTEFSAAAAQCRNVGRRVTIETRAILAAQGSN